MDRLLMQRLYSKLGGVCEHNIERLDRDIVSYHLNSTSTGSWVKLQLL